MSTVYHKRCKILYATSHNPIGPDYGARLRSYHIAKILQQLYDTSVVLLHSERQDEKWLNKAREEFDLKGTIPIIEIPRNITYWVRKEFDPRYCGIRNQTVCLNDRNLFFKLKRDYDLIWFHTVRIPDALGIFEWKKTILDIDDIQSQLYATQRLKEITILRRILDFRMKCIWRRREKLYLKRFNVLCVCSQKDKEKFYNSQRVYVVRNGYEQKSSKPLTDKNLDSPILGFIGSLDYRPNYNGVYWFIKKVWPIIKKTIPNVRLRLAGKETDVGISEYGLDIDGLGYVKDPESEIKKWSGMIVPIKQGGGTRIKIAEGFARRCPVIATKLGAYGYEIKNGREAVIADEAEAFAAGCIRVILDPDFGKTIAENAFKKYLKYYTWDAQKENISKAVEHCLSATK